MLKELNRTETKLCYVMKKDDNDLFITYYEKYMAKHREKERYMLTLLKLL